MGPEPPDFGPPDPPDFGPDFGPHFGPPDPGPGRGRPGAGPGRGPDFGGGRTPRIWGGLGGVWEGSGPGGRGAVRAGAEERWRGTSTTRVTP